MRNANEDVRSIINGFDLRDYDIEIYMFMDPGRLLPDEYYGILQGRLGLFVPESFEPEIFSTTSGIFASYSVRDNTELEEMSELPNSVSLDNDRELDLGYILDIYDSDFDPVGEARINPNKGTAHVLKYFWDCEDWADTIEYNRSFVKDLRDELCEMGYTAFLSGNEVDMREQVLLAIRDIKRLTNAPRRD